MVFQIRRMLFAAALIGLAISIGISSISAQGDVNDVLRLALQFLGKQLGTTITAPDNYTYQQMTFTDTSFGCPQKGKTYTPVSLNGYRFLITVKGVIYDVRISSDGAQAVLCTQAADVKQTVSFAIYRNPLFSIAYPDHWNVVDRTVDIFFGPGTSPVCSQPGMTAVSLGDVAAGQTPDSLLDDYAKQTPNATFEKNRISIGSIGRSVLYLSQCTNGAPRQARVTTFVAYGRGYRVLEFTPQIAFDQWSDVYLQILNQFSPSTGGSAGGGQPIKPPATSPLAFIAHVFAGNVYVGNLVDLPGVPITIDGLPERAYQNVSVSPKGDLVAFTDLQGGLYVASAKGSSVPHLLVDKFVAGYPIWKSDESEIVVAKGSIADGASVTYTIIAVKPTDASSREIDKIKMGDGCGSASPISDPARALYEREIGQSYPVLAWLTSGTIIFSPPPDCMATGGGQVVVLPGLHYPHLSPDQTEFIGVSGANALVRYRLADQSLATVKTTLAPVVAEWGVDGKAIFYATLKQKDTIRLDGDANRERGQRLFGAWPLEFAVNEVSLHRVDLATGADSELFNSNGYAIGRILPSPDGAGLLFTYVQSSAAMAEAFKNNASDIEVKRQGPVIDLYWLPFTDTAQLVAITSEVSWGPLGSANAPTPTAGATITNKGKGSATPTPPPTNTRQPTRTPTPAK